MTVTLKEGTAKAEPQLLSQFFDALYSTAEDSPGRACLYRQKPYALEFHDPGDARSLAKEAAALGWNHDSYFTVNLIKPEAVSEIRGRRGRPKESEVHSVVAMVADVDVAVPGKKATDYPPQDVALKVLDEMPLPASIVNLSGSEDGGLHVYWLLHEPFEIKTPEDLVYIKNISKRWQGLLKSKLAALGYKLDSTFDMVRVLRPAGSVNHKYGTVVKPLTFEPDRRYAADDFEEFFTEEPDRPAHKAIDYAALSKIPRGNIHDQARWYLQQIPGAVAGDHGHDRTFRAACVLVLGFGLSIDEAMPLLREWNLTCQPAWTDAELLHKIEGADARPGGRGYLVAGVAEDDDQAAVEFFEEDHREERTLDDWRKEMVANRLDTIGRPGLYADNSPTGAGKSYADRAAMRLAETSLTLLPDHSNCEELAAELVADGFDAAAYPRLDEETCQKFDDAQQAMACGLAPAATVCPGCPCRSQCSYLVRMLQAKRAAHSIGCHARGAKNLVNLTKDKKYVAVHENCDGMLRPMVTFHKGLGEVSQVAYEVGDIERTSDYADQELDLFADAMRTAADDLAGLLLSSPEGVTDVPISRKMPRPKNLDRRLYRAMRNPKCSTFPPGDALQTCIAMITGEVESVTITRKGKFRYVTAVWRTSIPDQMPVWFADATGDAKTLGDMIGRPVDDKTPLGRLPMVVPVVQHHRDITRGTSSSVVASLLRGVLAQHPEAVHVGVIGHSNHVKKLITSNKPGLDATTLERITKAVYFGQGPERASNDWTESCDLVITLGTPRVPTDAVQGHLVRRGMSAAADRDGQWGPRRWQGKDTDGQLRTIEGLGYQDPDWAESHKALVAAELGQCVGRGRPVLDSGVPVVLLSSEPLGLPLAVAGLTPITNQVAAVVESGATSAADVAEAVGVGIRRAQQIIKETTQSTQSPKSRGAQSPYIAILAKSAPHDLVSLVREVKPPPDLEDWHERAAILEYEGGQSREDAERMATSSMGKPSPSVVASSLAAEIPGVCLAAVIVCESGGS